MEPHTGQLVSISHMDNYIVLTPADATVSEDVVTEFRPDHGEEWDTEDGARMEVGDGGQEMDVKSEGGRCLRVQRTEGEGGRSFRVQRTEGDVAIESSLQVQSVKDIPKIVVDVQAFRCSVCGKDFHSIDVLFGHFQRTHREHVYNEANMERVTVKDAHLCYLCQHPFNRFDLI